MKGISHKQATQWIHRRMDGLLNESQLSSLDEHVLACDSCRAYAVEMDGLSTHIQNELHRHWGEQSGPSQNVMEHVTAKAREVVMADRISPGVKLFSSAIGLILLGVVINFVISQLQTTSPAADITGTIDKASMPSIRLLAFASDQDGNLDVYTVDADGSRLTNLTDHPARDSNPSWSLDGQHIAFESGRNGFMQIYLMNADGSNVVQLTHDEAFHYLPMNIHGVSNPWSPDGNKLLFLKQEPVADTSKLYSLDVQTGSTVMLANGTVLFNNISWSPDGKYVGYVINDSPTPEATFVPGIYVVDSAGGSIIEVNKLVPQTETIYSPSFYWSPEGNSIVFIAYQHIDEGRDRWIAYEALLKNNQLIERARSSTPMEDWWEGTSFIRGTDLSTLTWLRSDGTFNTFKPLDICQLTGEVPYGFFMKRSSNGNQAISIDCPTNEKWIYYASSDGTMIKPLLSSPIPASTVDTLDTTIAWSPDDQFIAVNLVSRENSRLYILHVDDPSVQPKEIIISEGELYTVPSWRPIP